MSFIVHIFVALFICSRIPSVWLLNDFTEVYSYLWMAVYIQSYKCIEIGITLKSDCGLNERTIA